MISGGQVIGLSHIGRGQAMGPSHVGRGQGSKIPFFNKTRYFENFI